MKIPYLHTAASPPLPLPDTEGPEVEVWRECDGTITAVGCSTGDLSTMHLPNIGSFEFGETVEGVVVRPFPHVSCELIRDAYRRLVLPMVLQVNGYEVLHASAVTSPDGVVAMCAPSGTGKSTTAFGLEARGWNLWADDAVVFSTSGDRILVNQIPFGIRLRPESVKHYGDELSIRKGTRETCDGEAPLSAVLILMRSQTREVHVERIVSSAVFAEVLAHAYVFDLRNECRKKTMMRNYLDLVSRVPVYAVRFYPDFADLPKLLETIQGVLGKASDSLTRSDDTTLSVIRSA